MFKKRLSSNTWLSILLFIGLGALLLAFFAITRNLSRQVFTSEQRNVLSYANERAISQAPITTNLFVEADIAEANVDALALNGAVTNEFGQLMIPVRFARWENSVRATLDARYEEQNNVSITMYDLDFESNYVFEYPSDGVPTKLEWIFPFPKNLETLNGVRFLVDGHDVTGVEYTPQQIRWFIPLEPGDVHEVTITYRADGIDSFSYRLNQGRRTEELDVVIDVYGLSGSEIPRAALHATEMVDNEAGGQTHKWQYENLVANRDIVLTLPKQMSFAQRLADLQNDFAMLASLAPFWVLFFLLALGSLYRLENRRLSLPTILMLGLGFALFYPLLTFLSGLIGLIPAALIALFLVSGLLLLYIHFSTGDKRAQWQLGWLLFIFLGILSLGLLLPVRGLMLTIGGFLLVGTFMIGYARQPSTPALPSDMTGHLMPFNPDAPDNAPVSTLPISDPNSEVAQTEDSEDDSPEPGSPPSVPHIVAYCPQCGRGQEGDYAFCPSCGHDAKSIEKCGNCGHAQLIVDGERAVHCVDCGAELTG